jgi:hypothetical protein
MLFYGYCGLDLLGGIYHLIMEIGRIHIEDFLVGRKREYGKGYWKSLLKIRIMSG